jgi:hypothetical protein
MALSKLRDYNAGSDGTFVTVVSAFETASPPTHRRVLITSDDGTCQGYERIADGVLFCGALVTPTTAKANADAAATAQAASDATALAAFIARCGQLNTKAKAGTLTAAEINESIAKLFRIAAALS